MAEQVERIVEFLVSIGLLPVPATFEHPTFLPGIDIVDGQLLLDRAQLVWPGDLLHEAGHLAVMPASLRPTLQGAIPDAAMPPFAGEVEATAWAFAAVSAVGLPPEVLFHPGGYHGKSANLIFTFSHGVYPGLAGLCAAGMAATPADVQAKGLPAYPRMLRWLRA